jgi:uncharacterized membrane protein
MKIILYNVVSILVLLASSIFHQLSGQETEWQLAKEKDGIEVYTRNDEDSKFKEFKALATIDAPVEKLLAIMKDIDAYTNWMPDLKSVEEIGNNSQDKIITYSVIEIPWPFEDRDIITEYIFSKDSETNTVRIDIQNINGTVPEKDGIIRMKNAKGFWIFIPLGNNKTAVHYQFLADPGGNIPTWLINMFIVDGPFKTLENMRKVAAG